MSADWKKHTSRITWKVYVSLALWCWGTQVISAQQDLWWHSNMAGDRCWHMSGSVREQMALVGWNVEPPARMLRAATSMPGRRVTATLGVQDLKERGKARFARCTAGDPSHPDITGTVERAQPSVAARHGFAHP